MKKPNRQLEKVADSFVVLVCFIDYQVSLVLEVNHKFLPYVKDIHYSRS